MENFQATRTNSPLVQECAMCGNHTATPSLQAQQFAYREGTKETLLVAEIPVISCTSCGETYTSEGAEEAQHDAVCRYLGRLTPGEIRTLRERNGLTQQKLAEQTGIGIASIKRWEAGNVIQNASLDAQLRKLDGTRYESTEKAISLARPTSIFQTEFSEETFAHKRKFKLRLRYQDSMAA